MRYSDYDQWVQDWIAREKEAGRKCFDVKKSGNNYYVYFQSTRYNPETKKRDKVSGYLGKLVEGEGLIEPDTYSEEDEQISPARYGLGIDTGGSFTDAVIIDLDDMNVVAKRKSPTTHQDLSIGLYNSVDAVFASTDIRPEDISLVGISTTLATNSILEGSGGEVGLILIGWNPMKEVNFGEKRQAIVKGGYDNKGRALAAMSKDEVVNAIMGMKDDVDAIAISGLFASMNTSQENKVKELAIKLTGLPVVAGHELSAVLGIDKRAETAVLNAKLIPVVSKFFDDVEETFRKKGIKAPIMAYKGDGSVMTLEQARLYPVETILSGPAASSMGGKVLSGVENCVIVDIGGTSTDIAIMEEGYPQIQFEGASVGRWRTRVKAVDMYTVALGGDSRIVLKEGEVIIGPDRVVPLATFSQRYPQVVDRIMLTDVYDYYEAVEGYDLQILTEREQRVYDSIVGKGPLNTMEVKDSVEGLWVIDDEMASLVKKGAVMLASLTPTDVMVYKGEFKMGNPSGARAGIHSIAEKMGMTERQAAVFLSDEIKEKVAEAIMSKMLDDQMLEWRDKGSELLLRRMLTLHHDCAMNMRASFSVPIIGIGAPSKFMMDDLTKRLGAEVLFPENYDVGNAVGAICSKITESLSGTVIPTPDYKFLCTVPFMGSSYHAHLEGAISAARRSLESYLESKLKSYGARNIVTSSKVKTYMASEGGIGDYTDEGLAGNVNLVEIISRAIGDPPEGN
ncbi:MAG: hydantoinase/oxoprolinase family protein [Candidatus Methanomethylophilaceae archaeon]|nr:hydantoinase/oxoprolinase family protein [Candidatus Methanomethylophilaceae archaeon]